MKTAVGSHVIRLLKLTILGSFLMIELHGVAAGAGLERIALMLDGETCAESHAAIEAGLRVLAGVKAVDFATVPGHVLIDIESGILAPDRLAAEVNKRVTGRCTAEVMKSCISAMAMK